MFLGRCIRLCTYLVAVKGQTNQSVQQLELQRGHSAAELGSIRTGLLATLQQLKQSSVHVEGLRGSSPKPLKVQDGGTQEGDLEKHDESIIFSTKQTEIKTGQQTNAVSI